MNENDKFIIIPQYICKDKNLSYVDKMVFGIIYSLSLAGDNDKCFATNKYLAEMLGMESRNIIRHINNLKNQGYLNITYNNKNPRKRTIIPNVPHCQNYHLNNDSGNSDSSNYDSIGTSNLPRESGSPEKKPISDLPTYNINNNKNYNKSNNISGATQLMTEIMEFYNEQTKDFYVEQCRVPTSSLIVRILQGYKAQDLKQAVVNMVQEYKSGKIPHCLNPVELFSDKILFLYL
jgi:uncharacterized phage protein (TIGR02220 family)